MGELLIQIGSVLGGLGFLGAVITAVALRRKIRAEADKTGADTTAVLTGSAMSMVAEIRADLVETQQEVRALRRHVGVLESKLRANGIPVPDFVWPPHQPAV